MLFALWQLQSRLSVNLAALQANLHGVLPVHKGTFGSLQQGGLQWGNRLKQMFAACHSLNMVTRSAVAGADMERSLFKAVEASFLVGICLCIVALPYLLQRRPEVRRCPTSVYKAAMENMECPLANQPTSEKMPSVSIQRSYGK